MTSETCCKAETNPLATPKPYDAKAGFAQVQALDPLTLTMRYRRGIEAIDRRVFEMTERQIDAAYLPQAGVGQWPVRVLIGHVADADLVFVERMRRCIGEDNPVVAVWDENSFVDSGIYGNAEKTYMDQPEGDHGRVMAAIGGPLATIHTLRQWNGQWLLSLPESAWTRKIMHPERGPQTLKNVLEYATWHLEHHAAFLAMKVVHVLGPAPAEQAGGGCGPSCGCSHP